MYIHPKIKKSISQIDYSKVISRLMYLMGYTRPNIAYAECKLGRYMSNLGDDHWQAIVKMLRY